MNTYSQFPRFLSLMIVLCFTLFRMVAQDNVLSLKGRILLADPADGPPGLSLTMDGQAPEAIAIDGKGRFRVFVPEGRNATLAFTCEGHDGKVVQVSTEHAMGSRKSRSRNRNIAFDVMLWKASDGSRKEQVTSAGLIRFLQGSGLMQVDNSPRPCRENASHELVAKE